MFVEVAIARPLDVLFTYEVPIHFRNEVQVGCRVDVPFGRLKLSGFVIHILQSTEVKNTKQIYSVDARGVIVEPWLMKICQWISSYYFAPLGEVLGVAVPSAVLGLKNKKTTSRPWPELKKTENVNLKLTESQSQILSHYLNFIKLGKTGEVNVSLLHGVTGSGKTEIYIELARELIANNKGVLFLVPEIALTPQLQMRLESRLGIPIGVWHSAMPDGKRRDLWTAIQAGTIKFVLGARSAVFAPIQSLGLIIVDEEHDPTYKQEDRVRYNARDVAIVRAKNLGASVILGTATPSLETLEKVRSGKYTKYYLSERPGLSVLPEIKVINMCEAEKVEGVQSELSLECVNALKENLKNKQQSLVFLNKRGFASFLLCKDCGHVEKCSECSISLTVYQRRNELCCHACGFKTKLFSVCSQCMGSELLPLGSGTERLEDELQNLIPEARIERLDRDKVTSHSRLTEIIEDFKNQKIDIMIGTQMLVKGHDFPNVTLVVVSSADSLLKWPDFRASERALQSLLQISGRAGRGEKAGQVLIQAYDVDHPVLAILKGEKSLLEFLEEERDVRKILNYPPFCRMMRIRFTSDNSDVAKNAIIHFAGEAEKHKNDFQELRILGPSEALIEKLKGQFRFDLLCFSNSFQDFQKLKKFTQQNYSQTKKLQIIFDVDPQSF